MNINFFFAHDATSLEYIIHKKKCQKIHELKKKETHLKKDVTQLKKIITRLFKVRSKKKIVN